MYTPGAKMVCVTANSGRRTLQGSSFTTINNLSELVKRVVFPGDPTNPEEMLFVVYAGPNDSPEAIAGMKRYKIRRSAVRDALLWLIENNPLYHDISINEAALSLLPADEEGCLPSLVSLAESSNKQTDDLLATGEGARGSSVRCAT
jgi:hypothetical protein